VGFPAHFVNARTLDDAINELTKTETKDELEYEMFEENEY
jgi:hypothetical protein